MTVLSVFEIWRSDVRKLLIVFVIISILDIFPFTNGGQLNTRVHGNVAVVFEDSRKLFGGYRITPAYCKAARTGKYNRGNTICMFNHECVQRGGEVVGACMDGFLFGACCQLKSDSQSHIPKGPGVVMTSYLDYPEADPDEEFDEADQLNALHNSFKPIVTPGYRPTEKASTRAPEASSPSHSTQSLSAEIISEGVSQITSTLLNGPNMDSNIIYIKPGQENVYTQSTINHNTAETYLINKNGSAVDNIARPSDFNVFISSLQTKPSIIISAPTTTLAPKTSSTHKPVYTKPVFKPKPGIKPSNKPTLITKAPSPSTKPLTQKVTSTTEKYVMVSTVTKDQSPAITSIIQMLNNTPSINKEVSTQPTITDSAETKSSPSPTATVSPVSYSSGYPNIYISTGHYVTLKPSANKHTITVSANTPSYSATTTRPSYNKYTTSPNSIDEVQVTSSKPFYSSPSPSQTTSQIDSFNRYPSNPSNFDNSVTTFSYVSSSSTTRRPTTTTTRKPPSTSYIFGSKPSKRPVTSPSSISTYDIAPENFGSVTPTVIVLNGFQTTKPETTSQEPQFVEISQEPFKKPVNHISINNNIQSTNNIYVGKPPASYTKPTVVITPKPSPNTTPSPSYHTSTSSVYVSYTDTVYSPSPTTLRPELYTSPDDLINFPPVRNPLLNATGSNTALYTNTTFGDNDNDILHDVEFTTPSFLLEDENFNNKINLFVNKIAGTLQGTFQELHDIVILDKKPNATKATTPKPTRKPLLTTRKPPTTTKKPIRLTTRRPKPTLKPTTTKKPVKLTTANRKPTTTSTTTTTTTTQAPTTTRRAVTTTKKPKPTKKVTTTTARITTTTELEEITTELYHDATVNYNDTSLCGVRPMMKSGRIVGGKNSVFAEWPWQVLVKETTWLGLFTKNKCGGVLITNKFVTTAAHCQPGFLATLVTVFGETDISTLVEPKRPVSRNVRRVIVHRQYDAATFANDLALLELESPIKFDSHIVPICMPPDGADYTGRMATVTGWGRLEYGGKVPSVLQEVQVPVIENSVCQELFERGGHTKSILSSFLCAGYVNGKKDSCEGDSGGPLVLQTEDGRWHLVGTVSHGIKCAAPYLPGVYMRTTYYKPWLKSITGVH